MDDELAFKPLLRPGDVYFDTYNQKYMLIVSVKFDSYWKAWVCDVLTNTGISEIWTSRSSGNLGSLYKLILSHENDL
jgi:hypothetical protein